MPLWQINICDKGISRKDKSALRAKFPWFDYLLFPIAAILLIYHHMCISLIKFATKICLRKFINLPYCHETCQVLYFIRTMSQPGFKYSCYHGKIISSPVWLTKYLCRACWYPVMWIAVLIVLHWRCMQSTAEIEYPVAPGCLATSALVRHRFIISHIMRLLFSFTVYACFRHTRQCVL